MDALFAVVDAATDVMDASATDAAATDVMDASATDAAATDVLDASATVAAATDVLDASATVAAATEVLDVPATVAAATDVLDADGAVCTPKRWPQLKEVVLTLVAGFGQPEFTPGDVRKYLDAAAKARIPRRGSQTLPC
jgi:hypothetical protein